METIEVTTVAAPAIVRAVSLHSDFAPIGERMPGGYFTGTIRVEDEFFGIITAPRAAQLVLPWSDDYGRVQDAASYNDGYSNTIAMAVAGSVLAQTVLALQIDGQRDFYIGSRDEVELQYRNLKPTTQQNLVSFRDGDNPSSVPVGYPYTPDFPMQTVVAEFRNGGAEAFAPRYHWTSTQFSGGPYCAWMQGFGDGDQGYVGKSNEVAARPVRRFKI